MPAFGPRSRGMLETVDQDMVDVCNRAILATDFAVICGARGPTAQNEAFRTGRSLVRWPDSKHNAMLPDLSRAVDIVPWHTNAPHIRWNNEREFVFLAGHMDQAAHDLGIAIRWGGNWDQDDDLYDRNVPFDLGHFELVRIGGEV